MTNVDDVKKQMREVGAPRGGVSAHQRPWAGEIKTNTRSSGKVHVAGARKRDGHEGGGEEGDGEVLEQSRDAIRFVPKAPLWQPRGDQGGVDGVGVPPYTQLPDEEPTASAPWPQHQDQAQRATAPPPGPALRGAKTSRPSEPRAKRPGCHLSFTPQRNSRREILTSSLYRGGN